jgi:FkbM family methyltransferase
MADSHPHDYDLSKKIKITFEDMDYWVMPRYRQHYLNESYEPFSLKLIKNFLGPESTLLDIGAHYGAYSIYAASKTGSKVIAIEPVNENFELLNENVKANRLEKKIKTFNVAASNEEGVAEFHIPWASDSAGFHKHPLADTIKKQTVIVKRIDNLTAGKKIDFIKIDTEGHEINVLQGLRKTLSDNPSSVLLIEANPMTLKAAGYTLEELISEISELKKEIYVVDEANFTLSRLTAPVEQCRNYINEDGYANLLCVPKADHKYLMYVAHSVEFGGAEMAMIEQIENLRKKNFLSHVVLPSEGGIAEMLKDKGISYSIGGQTFWQLSDHIPEADNNRTNMEAASRISALAERIQPDLIVNNTMVAPWGVAAATANQLPLLWLVHEYGDLDHEIEFPFSIKLVRRFIAEQSDLVICCSNSVKKVMEEATGAKNIYSIYNGLDVNKIDKAAKEKPKHKPFNINDDTQLNLVMVGRVKEAKGQELAIQAMGLLKKKNIKPQLTIIGPGETEYIAGLKKLIKQHELTSQVKILPYQPNPYPYIASADVLLTASNNEAFGRGTAEAMILGKPVIGSNSGGTAELIEDDVTGLLFRPGEVADLADKIESLATKNNKLLDSSKLIRERILPLINQDTIAAKVHRLISGIDYKKDRSVASVMPRQWVKTITSEDDERQRLLNELNSLAEETGRVIADLQNQNETLNMDINELVNSKSWKVTKPARLAAKSTRKIRQKK